MTQTTDGNLTRKRRDRVSQSNDPPSFPFYWRDWLASLSVRAMTKEQRGGYIDYLAYTYGTKTPGVQPEDDVRAMAGFTPRQWRRHRAAFRRCFRVRADGLWVQKRVVDERAAQKRRYKRAVNAGKEGARKRNELNAFTKGAGGSLGPSLGSRAGHKHQPHPDPYPVPDPEKHEKQVVPSANRVTGARVDASGTAGSNPIAALLETVLGPASRTGEGSA